MGGPRTSSEDAENIRPGQALDSGLPGHFVSPELEADTARFLEEMQTRIRLRMQAESPSLKNPLLRMPA